MWKSVGAVAVAAVVYRPNKELTTRADDAQAAQAQVA